MKDKSTMWVDLRENQVPAGAYSVTPFSVKGLTLPYW